MKVLFLVLSTALVGCGFNSNKSSSAKEDAEPIEAPALTCSYESIEGIDKHKLKITYHFADPEKAGRINRNRWQSKPKDFTSSDELKVTSTAIDRTTGDITIKTIYPTDRSQWVLVVSNYMSDRKAPTLSVKFEVTPGKLIHDGPDVLTCQTPPTL